MIDFIPEKYSVVFVIHMTSFLQAVAYSDIFPDFRLSV